MTQYSKSELLTQLEQLRVLFFSPTNAQIISHTGGNISELCDLLNRLKNYEVKWGEELFCNHDENPTELINKWKEFFATVSDEEDVEVDMDSLFKRTSSSCDLY